MKKFLCMCAISFAALTTFTPTPAQAAKAPVIFNIGDELFEVADFPQNMVAEYPELKEYKVSYLCQHFGLFWTDVWTWDCKLVAGNYNTNEYTEIPFLFKLVLEQQYPFDKAPRNFWNKYGIWVIGVGLLLFGLSSLKKESTTEEN
jgi:hypothetical protein